MNKLSIIMTLCTLAGGVDVDQQGSERGHHLAQGHDGVSSRLGPVRPHAGRQGSGARHRTAQLHTDET